MLTILFGRVTKNTGCRGYTGSKMKNSARSLPDPDFVRWGYAANIVSGGPTTTLTKIISPILARVPDENKTKVKGEKR